MSPQIESTRRALLAGLAAAPLAIRGPGSAIARLSPERRAWDAAMSRYHEAMAADKAATKRWHAAADAYERLTGFHPFKKMVVGQHHHPMLEEPARRCGYTKAEQTVEAACQRACAAADALVEMPAPDAEALLWKLEHLFDERPDSDCDEGFAPAYCQNWIDILLADARRILSNGRA